MKVISLPLLALTGFLSVFAFLISIALGLDVARLTTKALPVLALAGWVWQCGDRRVAYGLIAGAIGDIFLSLPDTFLLGMVAFALGHGCYVWAFWKWEARFSGLLAIPVVAYLAWCLSMMLSGTGPLTIPVIGYVTVIGAMIWRAAAVAENSELASFARWSPLAGALLFGFSDSLIGISKFFTPLHGADYVIILTYWAGQAMIAAAAVSQLNHLRERQE